MKSRDVPDNVWVAFEETDGAWYICNVNLAAITRPDGGRLWRLKPGDSRLIRGRTRAEAALRFNIEFPEKRLFCANDKNQVCRWTSTRYGLTRYMTEITA